MYKGIKVISYEPIESISLQNMEWTNTVRSNYFAEVVGLIDRHFDISTVFHYVLKTIMSLILENVHDHGSDSCTVSIGKTATGYVIEIFEKYGDFDLKKLPQGTGRCGYSRMKNSKCLVNHSADGKSTFVVIPTKK